MKILLAVGAVTLCLGYFIYLTHEKVLERIGEHDWDVNG